MRFAKHGLQPSHLDCESPLVLTRAGQQDVVPGEVTVQHVSGVQVGQGSSNLPCSDQDVLHVWSPVLDLLRLGLPEPALLDAVLYGIGGFRFLFLLSLQVQQCALQ